jgi:hypothetical protein
LQSTSDEACDCAILTLGKGEGNKCIGCVAVGVQGNKSASGFTWPEAGSGLWEFRDCVAHNNKVNGLFVWQNAPTLHVIEDFIAYHCGQAGVEHGAYGNRYHYRRVQLISNRIGIVLHALGTHRDPPPMLWEQITIAGSLPSLQTRKHNLPANRPVVMRDSQFPEGIVIDNSEGNSDPSIIDFVRCDLEPEDIDIAKAHAQAIIRVQRADGTAFQVLGTGVVTDIPPFE